MHNELNDERPIIIKRLLTDNLVDLIKIGFNNKFIDKNKNKRNKT